MAERRRRRKKEPFPWLEISAAVTAFLFFSGAIYLAYTVFYRPVNTPEQAQAASQPEQPLMIAYEEEEEEPEVYSPGYWVPKEPVTHKSILLLGIDNNGLSDVIMIATYDLQSYETSLISIKRDTYVENQTWSRLDIGQNQLAWANYHGVLNGEDYHSGANLAAYTIEELLRIDIHAYASINFEGFANLIDGLGGVTIEVAPGFAGLTGQPLPTGRQHLNGQQALVYSRHRRDPRIPEPGSTSGDGDRVRRNQILLQAIMEQCKELDTDYLLALMDDLEGNMATSMDDWDILQLANIFYHHDMGEMRSAVLPGEGKDVYEEAIEQDVYYFFLDQAASRSLLNQFELIR